MWQQINGFINLVSIQSIQGKICGILLPEENYLIAGSVMGAGYQPLQSRIFDRIILVVSDKSLGTGAYIPKAERFVTSIGVTSSDEIFANKIRNEIDGISLTDACPPECFWYQLGFLQCLFGSHPILPLILGDIGLVDIESITTRLAEIAGDDRVIVIGVSNLASGNDLIELSCRDRRIIRSLTELDYRNLWGDTHSDAVELSAIESAVFTAALAKKLGANKGKVLKHIVTSGLLIHKHIGMAAIAWHGECEKANSTNRRAQISPAEGYQLWELAAAVIVRRQNIDFPRKLHGVSSGVFISVSRGDTIIAQTGDLFTTMSLAQAVKKFATLLVSANPMGRFYSKNLRGAKLSICIADPVDGISEPTSDMGVYVRLGEKIGVLLPGEGADIKPKRRMELACLRAGIPTKNLSVSGADVHFFTVRVFSGMLPLE